MRQSRNNRMDNRRWISWLILSLVVASDKVSAIFVDEPLLYDTFPPDFIWASATSAHQIEGAWNVDGKGPSIWDTYTSQPGIVAEGATGQTACNSYYFYQKDVDALKSLNVSHYRFSISWPRVLPNGIGQVNQPGIDYYKNLIAALKVANIQPMVTLYHWDLPQALEDMGGWLNASVADWFEEYARLCFTQFGDDVKIWVTLNEPWITAWQGYGLGVSAPAKYGPGTYTYQAGHNLILAHAKAYRLYESTFKASQQGKVGIALNVNWFFPGSDLIADKDAAERALQFMGGWFANPIFGSGDYPSIMKLKIGEKSAQQGFNQSRLPEFTAEQKLLVQGSADFLGINHYTSLLTVNQPSNINDVSYESDQDLYSYYDSSWYGSGSPWLKITPFGLRNLLGWLRDKFNNPEMIITENGYSDTAGNLDDMLRIYYYKHYINNVLKAIKTDGVKVSGYTAWSLMDNFEWRAGYNEKFGLFNVDFSSPELPRTAKASARYIAQIIHDNGFRSDQPCNNYPISK
ncbi:lactase-phlorizin hydrolase-like [Daphnia pulicaria]|uniref:lactase-phlorizin hydrolase-like n=1 Tax=Daphnia pulicaria TaxID=35523 RepID=UPI001EEB9CDC|nr:lactase-phlorizin hydrolase-like [Daphnia pulicaria]